MTFESLGRLHPLLVHLPIGIILAALLSEVYRIRSNENEGSAKEVKRLLWLVASVSAILSCLTGLLLENEGDHPQRLTDRHKWSAVVTTLLACLGYAMTFSQDGTYAGRLWRRMFRVAVLAGILLTGHLGGSLTHGEGYLAGMLRGGHEEREKSNANSPSSQTQNTDSAVVYANLVAPILQDRCTECHGATKQKGGLRLDGMEALLKGGENGPVIVKGDPGQSELYRRMLLPMDDEDHMPPTKKRQPTEDEIRLLHWWILNGHDFGKKVVESSPDSGMREVISRIRSSGKGDIAVESKTSEWPEEEVPQADPSLLAEMRRSGILVMPVEPGNGRLQASLLNATVPADSALKSLGRISRQLVWLKADVKGLTDAACTHLSKLKNLTRLSLAGSSVTDGGLPNLSTLTLLRRLNLSGTAVTEKGLASIGLKPYLQQLFLFGTGVDRASYAGLQNRFPASRIDTGGYRLESTATDTLGMGKR
jgi:uncharacterized membrane protein